MEIEIVRYSRTKNIASSDKVTLNLIYVFPLASTIFSVFFAIPRTACLSGLSSKSLMIDLHCEQWNKNLI